MHVPIIILNDKSFREQLNLTARCVLLQVHSRKGSLRIPGPGVRLSSMQLPGTCLSKLHQSQPWASRWFRDLSSWLSATVWRCLLLKTSLQSTRRWGTTQAEDAQRECAENSERNEVGAGQTSRAARNHDQLLLSVGGKSWIVNFQLNLRLCLQPAVKFRTQCRDGQEGCCFLSQVP